MVLIDPYCGGAERVSCICSEAYGARLSAVWDPNIYTYIQAFLCEIVQYKLHSHICYKLWYTV